MATAKELREWATLIQGDAQKALDKVAKLREDARKLENAERMAKRAKDHTDHFERMFLEIGIWSANLNEAQHALVYAAAWEQGHALGYEEVESRYGELAELARKILDAEERVRD